MKIFLPILFLLSAGVLCGQQRYNNLELWYDRPATIWEEALPLGNGQLGAMVFGQIRSGRIQLNDNTLWSGYPEPGNNPNGQKYLPLVRDAVSKGDYDLAAGYWKKMQGPYSARYLPMADLNLDFDLVDTVITGYKRTLDLNTATASVTFRSGGVVFKRQILTSHPDNIMVIRLTADRTKRISFTADLRSRLNFHTVRNDLALVLKGKAPIYVANREAEPLQVVYDKIGEGMNFEVRLKVKNKGGTVVYTDSTLVVQNADAVTLYLSEATSFNGFDKSPGLQGKDPSLKSQEIMKRNYSKSYEQLNQVHVKDYQSLFNRVKFTLGSDEQAAKLPTDERMIRFNEGNRDDRLIALYYQYGRYLLISCSRPGAPPANLQGMWNDHVQPPWGSNYTRSAHGLLNFTGATFPESIKGRWITMTDADTDNDGDNDLILGSFTSMDVQGDSTSEIRKKLFSENLPLVVLRNTRRF